MTNAFVWIETHEGKAANVSWEAISVARKLADEVTALVFGPGAALLANEAIKRGADKALVCEDGSLTDFRLNSYASQVTALAKQHNPKFIVAGSTTRGTDMLSAVSVDLEAALIPDATDITLDGDNLLATRPVYSGKLIAHVKGSGTTQLVTIRNRAFPAMAADQSRSGNVEKVDPVGAIEESVRVTGFEGSEGAVSLTDASIIVSGGRGVGGPEGFGPIRELAEVLGAAVGASRAVVDAGWIPYEHQVGQTGKVVSPDLYIASGISGAVQHQAGMRTSKVIVAINKDPEAPIFKLAHYGIVGDLFKVVPALTAAFKQRLGK